MTFHLSPSLIVPHRCSSPKVYCQLPERALIVLTLKPEVGQGLKNWMQLPFEKCSDQVDRFVFPYSSTSKRSVDGHPRVMVFDSNHVALTSDYQRLTAGCPRGEAMMSERMKFSWVMQVVGSTVSVSAGFSRVIRLDFLIWIATETHVILAPRNAPRMS